MRMLPTHPAFQSCVAAATVVLCGVASAQSSPYYVGISQTVGIDSNVLRAADGAVLNDGLSRSDTVYSTALQAGLDQPIGRQRVYGSLSLRGSRYQHNDTFNNDGYNANVGLNWETVERLSGTLSASTNRSLASFTDPFISGLRSKNLEDSTSFEASARLGVVTQYSLTANLSHREVENSLQRADVQSRNFKQDSAALGLSWQPSDLINFGLGLRQTRGRYPTFLRADRSIGEDRFKRDDIDLTVNWRASGVSNLQARISSGKTRYDLANQRDFSGVTGSLAWAWQATGKTRFSTSLYRETGQDSYKALPSSNSSSSTDYSRVNTGLRLAVDYAATSKISATTSLSASDRDYTANLPGLQGKDRSTQFNIGARWVPLRSVQLGCEASTDRRKLSNAGTANTISANSFSCYGQLTLQ
jgi:hypothetical protein